MTENDKKFDGFGETLSPEGTEVIQVWINVRRDSMIPDFDAITEFKWENQGFEKYQSYNEKIHELLTEATGLFIEDALQLTDKDIRLALEEDVAPGDSFPIPALKALKKAICDYFEKTDQLERKKKATEKVVCRCRHVTDHEIEEAAKKGKGSYEFVKKLTGAGSGCGSCISEVKTISDRYL